MIKKYLRTCLYCKSEFKTNIKIQKFCCRSHAVSFNSQKNEVRKPMIRECGVCGKIFATRRLSQVVCGLMCRQKLERGKCFEEINPTATITSGNVGAISELAICSDLLCRGYYVFRSVGPHSPYDVIATMGGVVLKVEIRTGKKSKDEHAIYSRKTNHPNDAPDLWAVYVINSKEIIYDPPLGSKND